MPLNSILNALKQPRMEAAAAEPPPFAALIIDDQATAREILAAIMLAIDPRAQVHKFGNPLEALAWAAGHDVDIVLTDLRMPMLDGLELLRRLRALPHCVDVPMVVVTMVEDRSMRYAALEAGASDFLNKPLDKHECMVRCRNLMTLRRQQLLLHSHALGLQERVEAAVVELRDRELETLFLLAKAGEYRDSDTGNHVTRVSRLSGLIARRIGAADAEIIETAAQLHDIGKIGISDNILLKPGKLTEEEMTVMREHTRIGQAILLGGSSQYTRVGAEIAISHHERFDGSGYPYGLAGDAIPLSGRIVAVVDTLDALMSVRPYKDAWPRSEAFAYVRAQSGISFDPACVGALLDCEQEAHRILDSFR